MKRTENLKALLLTCLAPVFWSTGGIGVRLIESSPATILFWRSLFMTVVLLGWTLFTRRKKANTQTEKALSIRQAFPVMIFLSMAYIFYIYSVTNASIADSLMIQGTAPIFIVFLGWLVLHERIRPVTIGALVLVICGIGIILIQSLSLGGLSGNIYGLAKALAFAAATVSIRARRSVGIMPATTAAAVMSTLFALFLNPNLSPDLYTLAVLAYLGIFQIGLGYILFVTWSGKLSSSQTGLIVILEAVLGPIWPWLFLGERPFPLTFVGGGIIIIALVGHTLLYNQKPSIEPNSSHTEA